MEPKKHNNFFISVSPKLDASPLDFLFQFFTSLAMLNLNFYQIIALIIKFFRASLCKVKILQFVAFLRFLSFVLLHSPSIWCIFACHFSVWVNRHSFFPSRPFKTVFHISHFEIADVVDVEIPSLTPFAPSKLWSLSFLPAYQMLPLKNLNYFPYPCRLVKTNIAV